MGIFRSYPLDERLTRAQHKLRETRDRAAAGGETGTAGAWLLDHYTFLRAQVRDIGDAVPHGFYRRLPRLPGGEPRICVLAAKLIALTGAKFDLDRALEYWDAQQQDGVFMLAELWAIGPMMRLALVEAVAAADGDEVLTGNGITTLRLLDSADWHEFVEALAVVDRILREDPAGVYGAMDFETRDAYRHAVEGYARAARRPETEVASLAIELARRDGRHVGEYLVADSAPELKRRAGCRRRPAASLRRALYAFPNFFYLGTAALATAAITWGVWLLLAPAPWWAALLVLLPASQAALALVNPLVNLLVPPRTLPRLDFSHGIPRECRSFVVIPTLLLSRKGIERLLENLEIHYLANRDRNLLFALLTDFPDSKTETAPNDALLELCAEGIRRLNERHASDDHAPFYLFHRARRWNPSENVWMGWERKRGKLTDFNRYLLGEAEPFDAIEGDTQEIGDIRYVITLDSDTLLPRDTARKLVAAMAHPLNRPVFDERTGLPRRGYSLMQPRISVGMESAVQSQLAHIFSGQTGFDPYTKAVSDVYQDLYGRASFTGKGIYDLRAFHRATEGRFPENTLLSHDLIEGEHVRTALVTDLEFIDEHPRSYEAYSKRKHRWVRGDWQIPMWALPWAPDANWRWRRNRLPLVSRWKMVDNLRRSLVEPALFFMFAAGWFALGGTLRWPLAALALLIFPAWWELALALVRIPPPRFWSAWSRATVHRLGQAHFEALFHLVFLAHQAMAMLDAVGRTVARRLVTHKRLLEWESAAQAEASSGRGTSLMQWYLYGSPALATAGALALHFCGTANAATLAALELWIFAPLAARWVDSALPVERRVPGANRAFLRDLALSTWRYFADFCRAEDNWLVPDNVQEDPRAEARSISPTNLGLLLTAHHAAHDFGYLTVQESVERTGRTLDAMHRLPRWRGHFYNWYDTGTLLPILPHYISSVDSGNLAVSLVALKQGCLERLRSPLVDSAVLEGLRDHAARLLASLPAGDRPAAMVRLAAALDRQLDYRPTDLFYWESVLSEAAKVARLLAEHAEHAAARLARGGTPEAAEVRYWAAALNARRQAATRDLNALAPWLAAPFELELRMHGLDPTLQALLAELYRVPRLEELPAQLDRIAEKLCERLASAAPMHPALRRTLEGLLEALPEARGNALRLIHELEEQAALASGFVEEMSFTFLFDARRKLLHTGYNVETGRCDAGYYDLLASEARSAVFLAIAKGDLPREAWFHLGRKLTAWRGHRVLLSWSGTLFEYLMPHLFMDLLREHGAGPEPARGGGSTSPLRPRTRGAVGHLGIRLRRARQRHALSVLRLRRAAHRAEAHQPGRPGGGAVRLGPRPDGGPADRRGESADHGASPAGAGRAVSTKRWTSRPGARAAPRWCGRTWRITRA